MSAPHINIPSFVLPDGDITFLPGMDSNADPAQLPNGKYSRSLNTVNRGGVVQCRPGYECLFAAPNGNLQGGAFFLPRFGLPVILFAVEGDLFISEYPYVQYQQIPNVALSTTARQVFFKQVEQSVVFNEDGSLTFLTQPKALMIIQDGAFTAPIIFDGTTAYHDMEDGGVPLGGPMEWIGDRLWVARDNKVFASDLANPLSFREPQYIASVDAFIFSSTVTALSKTPSLLFPQLLVFTDDNTSRLEASVRDRSLWLQTKDFQKTIFPIGCGANRSVVTHYGMLWWWSAYGITPFDAAMQTAQTSAFAYRDSEMADSKSRLSEDQCGIAGISVENYLLMSVPSQDLYNRDTWVMDTSAYQTLREQAPASWNSVWTGTRPVEWLSANVNGTSWVLYFSKDYDGVNRLWRAFVPNRKDESCPITWYLETRGYSFRDPLTLTKLQYADVWLGELSGTVDVGIFWAGTVRGKYKRILTKRIEATEGTIDATVQIQADEILYALKKQSRPLRTQDSQQLTTTQGLSSAGVESLYEDYLEESFQLLIVVSGPGAVRGVKVYAYPEGGQQLGAEVEENETNVREVRFDGAAKAGTNAVDVAALLAEDEVIFRSTRTETVSVGPYTEIATGHAESVISQEDADKIATCIARRKASKALEAVIPSVISLGEGLTL